MASAGIAITDEVVSAYNAMKLTKNSGYLVFKLSADLKSVVLDKTGPANAQWTDFIKELPKDDGRYAVFDFSFKQEGGDGDRNKLLFILWTPDAAKVKPKMLYTSTKADLRKSLVGIGVEIQATDAAEIDYEAVLEKVKRGVK